MCKSNTVLLWDHSSRSVAVVSLKVFANGKATAGNGLDFLYIIHISHFLSRSKISDLISLSVTRNLFIEIIVYCCVSEKIVSVILTEFHIFLKKIIFLYYDIQIYLT